MLPSLPYQGGNGLREVKEFALNHTTASAWNFVVAAWPRCLHAGVYLSCWGLKVAWALGECMVVAYGFCCLL